jgi:SAM-dependent methyltransferase
VSPNALLLPPRGHLRATGSVDYIDRYYRGVLGLALRERLRWVRAVLPREGCARLLEIGYGSGVFFYEAARHADRVFGVDIHPWAGDVRRRCAADGVRVTTIQGDGCVLPFAASSIDVIVMISVLEFTDDPVHCLRESLRVLRPGGRIVAVTPRIHAWSDALWGAFAGTDPEAEFRGGRQRVERALVDAERRLGGVVIERYPRPRPLPRALAPYELVVVRQRARPDRRSTPRNTHVDAHVDAQSVAK